jgi:hypothetical protein
VAVRGVRGGLHLGPPGCVAPTDFQPNAAPIVDLHRRSLVPVERPLQGIALEHFLLAPHPLPSSDSGTRPRVCAGRVGRQTASHREVGVGWVRCGDLAESVGRNQRESENGGRGYI